LTLCIRFHSIRNWISHDEQRPADVKRRPVSNPLALAALACLYERPMHPYEMASTMRARGKGDSVKLNYGSLYTVVEVMRRQGLIEAQETGREGKRPERTVYRITDTGSDELVDWLRELLSVPDKEYLRFEAGLSYLPVLSPADAAAVLRTRCDRLALELSRRHDERARVEELGLPRLFVVEHEYMTALVEAELTWTSALLADIETGSLDGIELWRGFHGGADAPPCPYGDDEIEVESAAETDGEGAGETADPGDSAAVADADTKGAPL